VASNQDSAQNITDTCDSTAFFMVKAPDATEVAMAFATSLAPMLIAL